MNFEKNSATQLNQYASAVDMERLWGNIDKELRPPSRPMTWLHWSLSGLAVVLMAALFFAFGKSEKSEAALPAATEKINEQEPKATPAIIPFETKEEAIPPSNNPIVEQADKIAEKSENIFETVDNQLVVEKEAFADNFENTNRSISNKLNTESPIYQTKEYLVDKNGIFASKSTSSFLEKKINPIELNRLNLLPTKPINKLSVMFEKEAPQRFNWSPGTGCYSFGKKNGWKPYIAVYGGAQRPLKTLKADDVDIQSLADLRKETETVLEGVSGGALIGLLHPSGLHFELGGEYNRINERFEYTVTEIDTIGRTQTNGFIVNAPGDTTFFQDSVFVVQTNESVKKIYNKYSYIQIPITVGYEFNTNARLTPYVKGGIMVNVSFSQKAEIMTSPSTSVLYESSNADNQSPYPFRTRIGVSPHISLGMRYELNSWMHLFGEARYVHHLKASSAGDYPITQKYKLPGINIGMRFFKPIRYD